MTFNRTKQTLVALLCGILAAAFVAGCSSGDNSGGQGATHGDSATHGDHAEQSPVITDAPAGFNDADVAFATNMIPHHQQAVELTTLVPDRSTNPELLALAQQISGAQEPEITTMKAFLVQWNAGESAPADHSGHTGMAGMAGMVDDATMAKLATLKGSDFDRLWLQSMIGHHKGAIEMAQTELTTGTNVDAKKLAQDIVMAQEAEIDQMQKMMAGNP